ncbi:phospholipase DDHD1 isoform X1 [Poecilia latipinna]|uniref:phospholipase DDHD1 isoform X1 n=1 Tax=Poecilia latipinna TaxID=48699 RepID=UPI00072E34D6|nr:PREDICTED: phospholipase DDHD1 isoform X1 [Poecilia latipinna]
MSSFNQNLRISSSFSADSKGPAVSADTGNKDWVLGSDVFSCCHEMSLVDDSMQAGMSSVQPGLDGHLPLIRAQNHGSQDGIFFELGSPEDYLDSSPLEYRDSDGIGVGPLFERRKRSRSNSSRHRFNEVVTELVPEEVRWFYKEDKKTWKPFIGHDSLKIELMFRKYCELNPGAMRSGVGDGEEETGGKCVDSPGQNGAVPVDTGTSSVDEGRGSLDTSTVSFDGTDPDGTEINVEPVCVRGGLYEVDIKERKCYPVYWKHGSESAAAITPNTSITPPPCPSEEEQDHIPVMRGQWFIDGSWLPLEEEESDLIEQEHLNHFRGQHLQDTFETDLVVKTVDSKDVLSHLPPFYLPFLFKWSGYQTGAKTAGHKRKRCQAIHHLKLSRTHVDWHSVEEVYLYSDATTSKIARTVTQKLGFSKASSSGTRLHRGYVEEASPEDRPPQTTHVVFVVHGIGQKMDQGRIIKNTGMLREGVRKMEEKHFSEHNDEHVEFLPVEWRSKLALDGDTVDSITPDKVRGLRDLLNSSAMDIMYYNSPLYRDEITKGLTEELNRLYSLFCSRNPDFEERGGKVSIVSHSLGCVITYDIMTGWDPVRFCLQEHCAVEEEQDFRWMSYEERQLLEELRLTKNRLRELENQLVKLEASNPSAPPALKFKVENFFCMGSPLAVFLALRGIRPGTSGHQDHILPTSICSRLFNVFHPTDPVAYRLEPLILKHYSNVAPVQIHWCSATNPSSYDEVRPTFLNPVKDPASDTESIPSPSTSPVLARKHYGESITSLGKASILGAASIGKGLGGILFSRFSRSNSQPSVSLGVEGGANAEEEEEKRTESQSSYGLSTITRPTSPTGDTLLELERRIDFELREGLVESRYWSAVTSHTGYWCSHDIALFLLTFLYDKSTPSASAEQTPEPD